MSVHEDVAHDILIHCDRTRSKEARNALEKLVWAPLRKSGIHLTSKCLLAPENEVLNAQESYKFQRNDALWQCKLCDKIFKTEHFLDKHLARKHAEVRHDYGSACFADLCGAIVPCVPVSENVLPPVSSVPLDIAGKNVAQPVLSRHPYCDNEVLRRRRVNACVARIRHCVDHSEGTALYITKRMQVIRMRSEVCERAVNVECVPREEVWSTFGRPSDVLQTGPPVSLTFYVGVIVFALSVMIALALTIGNRWTSSGRRSSRRQGSRRLKRRKQL